MAGYTGSKEDYLKRLRRIEGQVRGISRMVEEDVYCIDVLTQISAASKALRAVSLGLLEDHMSHCVLHAAQAGRRGGHRQRSGDGLRRHRPARTVLSSAVRPVPDRLVPVPIHPFSAHASQGVRDD